MTLIEFGFFQNYEKIVIFSNMNNPMYIQNYDLDFIPLLDWSVSTSYNDELKEIRFKEHILTIFRCIVNNSPVFCYFIIQREKKGNTHKKITKIILKLEKYGSFNSIEDLKSVMYKFLFKNSLINQL